jgi:hypothetical protein
VLSPLLKQHFVLIDVIFFESQPYFSSFNTFLQWENSSEEKFVSTLLTTTTLPKHEYHSPSTEEPLAEAPSSIDKPCEPPVELRVYSIRQKNKTTSS